MCSPARQKQSRLKMNKRETGEGRRLEGTHPVITHGFVTVRAHEGYHAESMCDEFVGEHGRVRFDLHHVDSWTRATYSIMNHLGRSKFL